MNILKKIKNHLEKDNKKVESILASQNVKIFMKIDDSEETYKLFEKISKNKKEI